MPPSHLHGPRSWAIPPRLAAGSRRPRIPRSAVAVAAPRPPTGGQERRRRGSEMEDRGGIGAPKNRGLLRAERHASNVCSDHRAFGEIALPPELAGPWPACGKTHVPYTNHLWGRDRSPSGPLQDAGKPRRPATAVQARNWRLRRNRLTGEACRRCRGQGGDCLDSEQGAGEFPFA